MPSWGEATEGGEVLCNLQIPFIFIQQRILAIFPTSFVGLMHEAQANLPVSSSMGILLGKLLALSSWARTTVLQGTEICISGVHETVLCRMLESVHCIKAYRGDTDLE